MNTSPDFNLGQQLQEVTQLITLPEVYHKVRQLMDDEASDIDDFAEVISLDPNLSISVLKMVNSAYFGFPEEVVSVSQAINMIGIGQLHSMALGLSAISSLNLPNDLFPLKPFWSFSLYTGVLCRLLAKQLKIRPNEPLFVMGLLHEVGHLIFYAKFPDQAKLAVHIAETEQLPIHEAERRVLGLHYGDIGSMLMMNWGLATEYQTVTRYQPEPQTATSNIVETSLLHIAHGYAHQKVSAGDVSADSLINAKAWELTGLSPEDVDNLLEMAETISSEMERIIY